MANDGTNPGPTPLEVTPAEIGDGYLVDIRPKLEARGEPPPFEVPVYDRESKLPEIAEGLGARPLVLMCRTGRRSLEAATRLRAAGHSNVCSLAGGVRALRAYHESTQE